MKNKTLKLKLSIQVVAAIIEREGKFLITKRLETSHLGHCWEFPGGKIEKGESVSECIIRECREEIDVEVKPLHLLKEINYDYPEILVHLHFICELLSGTPHSRRCAEIRWVKPEELSEYKFPAADQEIIRQLAQSKTNF